MQRDKEIFDLINKENHRQLEGIELIASENFASPQVMEAGWVQCFNQQICRGLTRQSVTTEAVKWSMS